MIDRRAFLRGVAGTGMAATLPLSQAAPRLVTDEDIVEGRRPSPHDVAIYRDGRFYLCRDGTWTYSHDGCVWTRID